MPLPARTMLVVGTDVRVRADLDRLGRELGLTVTFLDDLPRALTAIASTRFDVIVLGPELVTDGLRPKIVAIEEIDERAAILAVLTSEDPQEVSDTFRQGAEDVLTMPLNAHELSAAIGRTFGPVPLEPTPSSPDRMN